MSVSSQAGSAAPAAAPLSGSWTRRSPARAISTWARRPELALLLGLAAVLNLWALSRNGWANDYYSAAVRSMSTSWHDFLFASLDPSGVMTVDKPPLALWVQALSVRAFGLHPLSILVPQALMGVASVALVYDLVARRFGRLGGFVGGLTLALTPITVAISRHNNPDALLVLCSVAALWCAVRGLDPDRAGRRLRWLVLAGICVGLGFETKMGVALVVVPGIAAAWLYVDPSARGRVRALGQLLAGGVAMVLVGGAWPALVELVPGSQRPWISGTSDNRVLSLIFEYNGLGRVDGQAGGPGGVAGTMFGGATGPLRLLNSALGGQVGWLLGFALVSAIGLLLATRLRRSDPRTGWLIAVGGAFVTSAVLFSAASGIFHPYYVSLLAPFLAALVGAGAALLAGSSRSARMLAPIALAAAVATELAVRHDYPGQLPWLAPVLIVVAGAAALAIVLAGQRRAVRLAAVLLALAALLAAPATWALDTLGHATSGTFPAGGPASVADGGVGGGPPGAGAFGARGRGFGAAREGGMVLFGNESAETAVAGSRSQVVGSSPPTRGNASGAPPTGSLPGLPVGGAQGGPGGGSFGAGAAGGFGGAGGPGGGGASLTRYAAYADSHGGGTIAVASQSSAASAILDSNADVAGIGGFSGRESDVSVSWLAAEVAAGKIRWVLDEETGSGAGFGALFGGGGGSAGGLPGEERVGARTAMAAVARACTKVTVSGASGSGQLYDCAGHSGSLVRAGESRS